MEERIKQELKKITEDNNIVKELLKKNIKLSDQAKNIINNSTTLKEMGQIIFLDRYAQKDSRNNFHVGDLVIAISKDHPKYPKKDIGIITEQINGDNKVLMLSGAFKDDIITISKLKCDKPLESIYDAYCRVAEAVASVEKEDDRTKFEEKFKQAMLRGFIQPAGRIMVGANVDKSGNYISNLTLYNCYVIPSPKDSRKSIVKDTLYQMVEIFSRGGGVGINLSTLRPKYAHVHGVNGKSSGSVSWGGLYSYTTGLIEQGGSRRGALMLMMSDWHPDVMDFITAKREIGFLDNANISVLISNNFMEAVKQDKMWKLEFPDIDDKETKKLYDEEWDGDLRKWQKKGYKTVVFKEVRAKDMWHELIESAWKSAEPGIVFIDRYNDYSNSYYFNPLICTNPCGEQGLPAWGVCNLGHLALNNFLYQTGSDELGPLYDFDWDSLKESATLLTRFLDNVIDLTPYIFKENEDNQKSERRVGLGTLGLAEVLIRLRIKFGSEESLKFIDKLYKEICVEAYKSSISLAKEKGVFSKLDIDKYMQSGFVKGLPEDVQEEIKKYGIRNVTLTTQAPTGTVGSMVGTSTGIEPFYAFKYYQQSRLGFHEVEIDLCQDYKKTSDGKLPEFFVSSMQLSPEDHIKVQAAIQRWTDSSISKTANAPANFTVEDTMKLYEFAFDLKCKGVTIYRDGSRDEQVLSTDSKTEEKNASSKTGAKINVREEPKIETKKEEVKSDEKEVIYGSDAGNTCPQCKKGTMIKFGGCTECNAGCGFKGSCDMK